jgi:hypothetical protein
MLRRMTPKRGELPKMQRDRLKKIAGLLSAESLAADDKLGGRPMPSIGYGKWANVCGTVWGKSKSVPENLGKPAGEPSPRPAPLFDKRN